jgi:hypothetical protein
MRALFVLALSLGAAVATLGQGTIIIGNSGSPNYRLWTNNASGTASNLMSGGGYGIGFYVSTNLGASAGSLELVGVTTNSASPAQAGYYFTGPLILPNGYPGGGAITFQVRAWSRAGGLSYAEALLAAGSDPLNIALGVSPLGTVTLGNGIGPTPSIWGTGPGQLSHGFEIRPIPEPSIMALGVLGLGAIALFRRRM